MLATSDDVDSIMSTANNTQKVNRMSPSNSENCPDKMNIFNVARIKKVELNDLPSLTKVGDENGKFETIDISYSYYIITKKKEENKRKFNYLSFVTINVSFFCFFSFSYLANKISFFSTEIKI